MKLLRGLKLTGGDVEADGTDVTVHAPTPDLRNQAVVSNPRTDALLIGRDTPLAESACFSCQNRKNAPIGVQVKFPRDEGYRLSLCLACINEHQALRGKPFLIDMEFVD